jgi:CheY-like chemotaxis protein
MLKRRVALPLAALTALASMPVLAAAVPAGASSVVVKPTPASRGGDNGDPEGPREKQQKQDNCPTKAWTIPLELKGLACILLLPKPEQQGGEGGGGLGGLLG